MIVEHVRPWTNCIEAGFEGACHDMAEPRSPNIVAKRPVKIEPLGLGGASLPAFIKAAAQLCK